MEEGDGELCKSREGRKEPRKLREGGRKRGEEKLCIPMKEGMNCVNERGREGGGAT